MRDDSPLTDTPEPTRPASPKGVPESFEPPPEPDLDLEPAEPEPSEEAPRAGIKPFLTVGDFTLLHAMTDHLEDLPNGGTVTEEWLGRYLRAIEAVMRLVFEVQP